MMELDTIFCGDALDVLRTLPDNFVHCCITSPPYYALRDYGVDGQIGREDTPAQYVARLTEVFSEVWRVLRPNGTLWLNIADSYCGTGSKGDHLDPKNPSGRNGQCVSLAQRVENVKAKDMILGTMASESVRRQSAYLKNGCNAYDKREPTSQPLSFWTEQDVLAYLKMTDIPYASVYGEIVEKSGKLATTGAKRTGCMFCMFGVHLEKQPNRFQRMALTHPKQYEFCIHKLGCGAVLDFLGVPYCPGGDSA